MFQNFEYMCSQGPEIIKLFSCSAQLSIQFSLLMAFSCLLAKTFSCSAMFSKKEFGIVSS